MGRRRRRRGAPGPPGGTPRSRTSPGWARRVARNAGDAGHPDRRRPARAPARALRGLRRGRAAPVEPAAGGGGDRPRGASTTSPCGPPAAAACAWSAPASTTRAAASPRPGSTRTTSRGCCTRATSCCIRGKVGGDGAARDRREDARGDRRRRIGGAPHPGPRARLPGHREAAGPPHPGAGRPRPARGPAPRPSACRPGSATRLDLPGAADALVAVHFPRSRAGGPGRPPPAGGRGAARAPARPRPRCAAPRPACAPRPSSRATGEHTEPLLGGAALRPDAAPAPRRPRDRAATSTSGHPMRRLLQGEVGSGKTLVAVLAMCQAVEAGAQAALLVPTETLAEQHLRTLDAPAGARRPRAGAAHGQGAEGRARAARDGAAHRHGAGRGGHAGAAVGGDRRSPTSAWWWWTSSTASAWSSARRSPSGPPAADGSAHILYMTATPIPRTLALTAYGDLTVSTIRTRPPGRSPVETRWIRAEDREGAYEEVRAELRAGRQAYVICPLVEEGAAAEARAATTEAERLREGPFAAFSVGLVHGAQGAEEKRAAMLDFAEGRTDLLVATTVVEVGIDVPNATVIVIEDADRFGLAQLHQLRGRVGRGEDPGPVPAVRRPRHRGRRPPPRGAHPDERRLPAGRAGPRDPRHRQHPGPAPGGSHRPALRPPVARPPRAGGGPPPGEADAPRRPPPHAARAPAPARGRAAPASPSSRGCWTREDRRRHPPRPPPAGPRRHRRRGPPRTGSGRPCSRSSGRSTASTCSTCSPAPGALGLEALSRGAASAVLVERVAARGGRGARQRRGAGPGGPGPDRAPRLALRPRPRSAPRARRSGCASWTRPIASPTGSWPVSARCSRPS